MKAFTGFFFAVWLAVVASGCSRKTLPPTGELGSGGPASVQAGDVISAFTLVGHTEAGRKKWQVQGETADLLSDTVKLSPVRATSFGRTELILTADEGEFHKASQNVYLRKNVVAITSDGAKLVTDSLDWTQKKETGTTPDWVTVARQGMTARGLGGIGFPKLKRVRLERQVTVVLDGAEGVTVITCDGPMEVDYGRHKARFWRNVLVRDGKGFVRSDRLDVTLTPDTHQLEKATFWGHVQIHQENKIAYANRANYWQSEGRIRLMGHPRLVALSVGEGLAD